MTQPAPIPSMPPRPMAWKLGMGMAGRLVLSLAVLFSAYFFIPTKSVGTGQSDLPYLLIFLGVFAVVVAFQVPAIIKAKYPVLRAIEALALVIAFYLLIFARIYLSNSLGDPAVFTQQLNHTTALYFTVTVFATVGFGDIVAATDGMKGLVTVQMVLNLVVLGLIIRLLSSAAQRGVAKHQGPPPPGPDARAPDAPAPDAPPPDRGSPEDG